MKTYNVKLAEGVFVRVNADNPEDATAKAKAVIAKREGSKAYDKVYFDYETGIQDNALRAGLSVAEDYLDDNGEFVSEKENYLKDKVGSDGFVRDSKGSIALTPKGQARLGLEPSDKNIVIDENKAFTSGDFADMAGYVGPIAGAIAAVNPYMRGIKFLRGLVDSRVGRALLVGAGSAAGKGVEEANEIARGVQLQNNEQLADLYQKEFVIGGIAQGAGEILGGIFTTYFGKTASHGAIRDSKFITEGYDLVDILKADKAIAARKGITDENFKATRKEVLKELKKLKVKPSLTPGIIPQSALGRTLPARGQSIAEAVTGASAREKRSKANILQMMNRFFESIGNKNATIDDFIDSGAIGQLAKKDLLEKQAKIKTNIEVSDQQLDSLLRLLVDEMNVARGLESKGLLKPAAELKASLKNDMYEAYSAWRASNKNLYDNAQEALENTNLMPGIQTGIKSFEPRFANVLDDVNLNDSFSKFSGAYQKLKALAEGEVTNLSQLVNAKYEFKAVMQDAITRGKTKGSTYQLAKKSIELIDELQDSIRSGQAFVGVKGVSANDVKAGKDALNLLKEADKEFATTVDRFTGVLYKDLINKVKINKTVDPEEIFGFLDGPGKGNLVKELFGSLGENAEKYRGQITGLLFRNVIEDSIDSTTKLINPVKFTTNLLKYDSKTGPSTLKELFGPKYSQNIALIKEINNLNPKLSKKELETLLKNIDENPNMYAMGASPKVTYQESVSELVPGTTATYKTVLKDKEGLIPEIDTGNNILKIIKQRAESQKMLEDFNKQSFMKNVLNETPDRIVANVFGPGSAKEINYLKVALEEETFRQVQENAMGQLLTKAVSTGKLKNSSSLADIFKPNVLRNTLESYGDDTLIAMFGKEQALALKALQQSLDLQVGAAQGLTAGGIVAGAIGAQALNISLLPTILGLKIFANVFANPKIVKMMANTDQSSVMMVIDAFEKAARLASAQAISQQAEDSEISIRQEIRSQLESPENQATAEEIRGQVEQIAKPIKASVPDLPDIVPTSLGAQSQAPISRSLLGNSPANEDIAQRLNQIA